MPRAGMAWLIPRLTELGCTCYPSQTNFFLVDLGLDCRLAYEAMLRKGVIVRPMSAYGFPTFIRITVGTTAENERLATSLAATLQELAHA